jgi:hypothetical protein
MKQPQHILEIAILEKGIYLIKINSTMTKKFIVK